MFCIECGTTLPEGAKFCFNCGINLTEVIQKENSDLGSKEEIFLENKIEVKAIEEEKNIENSNCEEKEEEVILNLGNRVIRLPYLAEQYVYLENRFNMTAEVAKDLFLSGYNKEYNNLEELITYSLETVATSYEMAVKHSFNFAEFYKYNNFEDIFESYIDEDCFEFLSEIQGLANNYEEIMLQVEELEYERAARKASRGMWQGGGFGIGGAIKGAITAKAMNTVSGAMHSIANGIGNVNSKSKAESEFRRIYNDKTIINNLAEMIYSDIINIKDCVIEALEDVYNQEIPDIYNDENIEKSIELYNNITNKKYDSSELLERIIDMLTEYPFDEDYYIQALVHKPGEIDGLEEYAEFFKISYKAASKEALEIREYNKKIKESLGEAADLFESILEDNVFYDKLKFKYKKDLICNIEDALNLCNVSRLYYIYKKIDKKEKEKFYEAFENYAEYENEVPILYYEESSLGKRVEGIVLTNKNIYFTNKQGEAIKIKLENIENVEHSGSKLILNNENISIYMMDSKDRGVFVQLLTYIIVIIANSKLSGIESGNEIKDVLKLRDSYYGSGAKLSDNFGSAKELLDNNLSKNSIYHSLKSKLNAKLDHDIELILSGLNMDKAWYIYSSINESVQVKVDNAINTYANIKGEVPILIYDGTAFGSAKEGFMITEEAFYYKEFMGNATRIPLTEITFMDSENDKFIINSNEIGFGMIDGEQRSKFSKIMELLVCRLIVQNYCPSESAVKLENKLKLNKSYDYDKDPNITFSVDRNKDIKENIIEMINISCNKVVREQLFVVTEGLEAERRFEGAAKNYLISILPNEYLIMLYDNTISKSGKDGFFLTNQSITYKNMFSKPKKILYKDINKIEFKGTDLIIGEHKIFINNIPKHLMGEFNEVINEVITLIKSFN